MSRIIVIDWGSHEVRLLEGEVRGGRVVVQRLTSLPLPEAVEGGESDSAGVLVRQALASRQNAAARVIGLVGRTQAVLRDLRVPDAPPDEMPGIIQFQAMRELSFPIEEAAIDYEVVGPPEEDGQRRVVLAALQRDLIQRYEKAITESKLELSRMGLRPYATWRAYRQVAGPSHEAVLVVSLAGESLELTVARDESVLFSRATLLREAADGKPNEFDPAAALVTEVRRTLAAFSNQTPGVAVQRIVLPAGPREHQNLSDALAANLTIPVDRFDPFQAVELDRSFTAASREGADPRGAYVAAVGAALATHEPWPIDFLNAKKPVARRDRKKPLAILASAAALLALLGGYWMAHQQIAQGKAEIKRLTDRQNELKKTLQAAAAVRQQFQAVEEWIKSETNCLEQLRQLSEAFPDTRAIHATALSVTHRNSADSSGRIVLEGAARELDPISAFHRNLNKSEAYSAQPVGPVQANSKSGTFRYSFKTHITVKSLEAEATAQAKKTK